MSSNDDIEEELIELFNDYQSKNYKFYDNEIIYEKLDEILRILKKSEIQKNSDCEEILNKGYIIKENFSKNTNPNLIGINIDNERYLVTFKDTLDLLLMYFKDIKKEDIENYIPRRLLNLFIFLKKNGLIYFDVREKEYKLTI
ncbi:hypothetical protein DFR86_03160 [Acidianus sulfidivorans JP7]|uniref:Uncharacterized protein n=1 Tax=Acidianus sulfidivorans JP7 TaxID=619593 RepID=A0A2U9IKU1_9CREN|nr:hypothetical protein [Acidianus sulfidivorans]AWR96649.1 hypothetical protein DFR86_03160 [Acidianus sulfidivorans JP7]